MPLAAHRRRPLAVLMFALATACAGGPPATGDTTAPIQLGERVADPTEGYAFAAPTGWVRDDARAAAIGERVSLHDVIASGQFYQRLSLRRLPAPKQIELATRGAELAKTLGNGGDAVDFARAEPTTANGFPALRVEGTWSPAADWHFRSIGWEIYCGDDAWVLACSCHTDAFERALPRFAAVLASLELPAPRAGAGPVVLDARGDLALPASGLRLALGQDWTFGKATDSPLVVLHHTEGGRGDLQLQVAPHEVVGAPRLAEFVQQVQATFARDRTEVAIDEQDTVQVAGLDALWVHATTKGLDHWYVVAQGSRGASLLVFTTPNADRVLPRVQAIVASIAVP